MLTFGAAQHLPRPGRPARPTPTDVAELVDALLEPAVRHRRRAGWCSWSTATTPPPADGAGGACSTGFDGRRASRSSTCCGPTGSRWFPLLPARGRAGGGRPYDVSAHPFAAAGGARRPGDPRLAGGAGRARCDTDPDAVAAVERGWPRRRPVPDRQRPAGGRAGCAATVRGTWTTAARPTTRGGPAAGRACTRRRGPRRRLGAADPGRRPPARRALDRRRAARPRPTCRGAGGRCSAFAAWLAGHGALAWCAVDRCAEADARLLAGRPGRATLLEHGVPPSAWEPDVDWPAGSARPGLTLRRVRTAAVH